MDLVGYGAALLGWSPSVQGSSSQERVNAMRAVDSFAGGELFRLFVCLEVLAGKKGGENYLSDSEVAMNSIKPWDRIRQTPPRRLEPMHNS